jgi:hypothetical protein
VPKVGPWELPTNMQWELCWDNQVVVGKVADLVRGTIQNTISCESTYRNRLPVCFGQSVFCVRSGLQWL